MELSKLAKYLGSQDRLVNEEDNDRTTNEVFGLMVNLVCSLDPDNLDDNQYDLMGSILESFGLQPEDRDDDDDEEDDESEDLEEKRIQKISRRAHVKAHSAYKAHKAQLKMMNKRFRKSAKYKMWKRKHARMVKAGRTKRKKYV